MQRECEKEAANGFDRMITANEHGEQGYHWERATSWGGAMISYFKSGMVLNDQGDSQGSLEYFSAALKMLDCMRHDAGINYDDSGATPEDLKTLKVCLLGKPIEFEITPGMNKIFCGRNSGLSIHDIFKLFDGDSELLQTAFSLLIRLAQALIGYSGSVLSYRLYEDAMDMMKIVTMYTIELIDRNGQPFDLQDKEMCFSVLSGMFLLLLMDHADDDEMKSKRSAAVEISLIFARSDPTFEVHLVLALQSKLRLLESFLHRDPSVMGDICITAQELMSLYNAEKHSQKLIFFY